MSAPVTISVARVAPVLGDAAGNLRRTLDAIAAAADRGSRLVVLPELVTSGYAFAGAAEARAAAEPVPGPTTTAWSDAAACHGIVVVGGVCEVEGDGILRNSAVVVDADGSLRATYRKVHLWGGEQAIFVAGDEEPPVVETAAGRIGVAVCYDLWFPEHARSLALRGAQVLACPTNLTRTPAQPGLPHSYLSVAVATAQTSRLHVALADRCGDERGAQWLGLALVVDADGTVVAGPPDGEEPALATATVDLAAADDKRWGPSNDVVADRRPSTYRLG